MLQRKKIFSQYLNTHLILYVMMVPALVYLVIFKLVPLYGTVIAFKDYNIFNGKNALDAIGNSEWVGLENFIEIFQQPEFGQILFNTFWIAILKLLVLFPLPILVALLLSELTCQRYKKLVQTVIYLPHFFSWVVVAGIAFNILGTTGLINQSLQTIGADKVNFMMNPQNFLWVLIGSDAWKETGFNAVVYIAAIAAINPEMYEAAQVDGASRLQRMVLITLPNIMPTVLLMFILKVGKMLEENFPQIASVSWTPAR